MTDKAIEILLIILLIFTPIAFGSQVLWAFSLMELGILLIIILWAVQRLGYRPPVTIPRNDLESEIRNPKSEIPNPQSEILCLQSEIRNPKFPIRNPKSYVSNPKSEIRNPKFP